jgi:hypothetical protein
MVSSFSKKGFTNETIENLALIFSRYLGCFTKEALGKGYKLEFGKYRFNNPREDSL